MPSIYVGCKIEDDVAEALKGVRSTFKDYQDQTDSALAALANDLAQLSGTKQYASVVIGSSLDNQVRWTAKSIGEAGNDIRIMYRNLGPIFLPGPVLADRPTSAEVVGNVIYVTLAIHGGNPLSDPLVGSVDSTQPVSACLPVWLSNPDVAALVDAELVGSGSDIPEITSMVYLSGGEDTPLSDAEDIANSISKNFGHNSYQAFMGALDIPVVESDADAAKYLESVDDEYVIVNKKLFLVEGTNLVGFRNLYQVVQKDLSEFKRLLSAMVAAPLAPHVAYSEVVEEPYTDYVCNELVQLSSLKEYYIDFDTSITIALQKSRSKQQASLNTFAFWIISSNADSHAYIKLDTWGFPDAYITDMLSGESPEQWSSTNLKPPVVSIIEIPDLFDLLHFSDAEIVEILEKDIAGIKPPSSSDQADRKAQLDKLIQSDKKYLDNGLNSRVKKPVAALQALDISATMNDDNLARELATRGKACARTSQYEVALPKVPTQIPEISEDSIVNDLELSSKLNVFNVPDLPAPDMPNLPTEALPDAAKKVESAYAALSSVISSASKLFDVQINGVLSTCKAVLNKVQNLQSLADNLFNNNLVKCLLGTSTAVTGLPDVPSPGNPVIPTPGSVSLPSTGLPLPMSLFKDILKKLSVSLDKAITSAFETLMKLISAPLCMVNSLLASILGFDLGGLTNPCKDSNDPDSKCNKNEVQEIINNSTDMSLVMDSLPQMESFPTERVVNDVTEQVQKFTGDVVKSVDTTIQDIERGMNEVMSDLTSSLDSKLKVVDALFKAVKELVSDGTELADNAEETESSEQDCSPPSLGAFTDTILSYI